MNKEKIIMDTEPGMDGAVALVIDVFSDKLDVKLLSFCKKVLKNIFCYVF